MIPLKLFHIAKNWLQIDILCLDTDYFKIETVFSLKPDVVCRNIWYYANSSLAPSLTKIRQSWICWYNHIPWNSCDSMNRDLIFYRYLYYNDKKNPDDVLCGCVGHKRPISWAISLCAAQEIDSSKLWPFCLFQQHHPNISTASLLEEVQ